MEHWKVALEFSDRTSPLVKRKSHCSLLGTKHKKLLSWTSSLNSMLTKS
jgi:hypothetical protein